MARDASQGEPTTPYTKEFELVPFNAADGGNADTIAAFGSTYSGSSVDVPFARVPHVGMAYVGASVDVPFVGVPHVGMT
jgi:hypothetical protein